MNIYLDEYLEHWNVLRAVLQKHVFEGVLWCSCSEKIHKIPVKIPMTEYTCNFLEKELRHKCFPGNFWKLRYFQNSLFSEHH